jgi:C1A family cysteine protease
MFGLIKNYFINPIVELEEVVVHQIKETREYKRKKDNFTEKELNNPNIFYYKKFNTHKLLNNINGVDLRNKMPPVYNQGKLGSCTANAICAAYEYEMMKQNEEYKPMSRLFLYYQERKIENTINEDSGAQIKDGIFATAKTGLCEEKYWTYDITKFTVNPSEEAYLDAGFHKTVNYARIYQREDDLKQSLLDGYPVVFGINVYSSFESDDVAKTGIVPMPTSDDKLLGGHAILIVGFKEINNTNYFIVRNSWGENWGDSGYCYLPFEYVLDSNLSEDFWSIKFVDDEDNKLMIRNFYDSLSNQTSDMLLDNFNEDDMSID